MNRIGEGFLSGAIELLRLSTCVSILSFTYTPSYSQSESELVIDNLNSETVQPILFEYASKKNYTPALELKEPKRATAILIHNGNELKFTAQPVECIHRGQCLALYLHKTFDAPVSRELVDFFNCSSQFIKIHKLPDGKFEASRYIIANYGTVRRNLSDTIEVFDQLVTTIETEFLTWGPNQPTEVEHLKSFQTMAMEIPDTVLVHLFKTDQDTGQENGCERLLDPKAVSANQENQKSIENLK